MATAKQILYSPPLTLLPKRKDTTIPTTTTPNHHLHHHHHQGPTLTVTIPFPFTARLSRLDSRRQQSPASIRRSSIPPTTPRPTPRTTSLPRLAHQPSSARPSLTTTKSAGSRSAKKTNSGSVESGGAAEAEVAVPEAEEEEVLSPEEAEERRLNEEKCQQWLQGLPDKFSSMHVVQHVVYNGGKDNV